MRNRFCPKCGANITSGVFCENCIVKELHYTPPLVQVSEFNRALTKGRWVPFEDIEDVLTKNVQEALGKKLPVSFEEFSFEPRPKNKITVFAKVIIDNQEVRLPVKLSYRQCDFGQKEKTEYFEGILQLRNPSDTVISFIEQELKKVAIKGVFITKMVDVKDGVDIYLTNKSYLRLIAQKIHAKFGGIIKLNPQLFSHNHLTSKDIFRLNVYVQLPDFGPGDVISFIPLGARKKIQEKKIVLVKKLGKIITGTDMQTGKKVAFEGKYTKDLTTCKVQTTKVLTTEPNVTVLHPETFQAIELQNKDVLESALHVDDTVDIILTKQGAFFIRKT